MGPNFRTRARKNVSIFRSLDPYPGSDPKKMRVQRVKILENLCGSESENLVSSATLQVGIRRGVRISLKCATRRLRWVCVLSFVFFSQIELLVKQMISMMYEKGASFNFYMFHGGTNFQWWNGAEYAAGVGS